MNAVDFEYDGQYLSDYGFTICKFDSGGGTEVETSGAEIVFNTVARHKGRKHTLVSSQYDTCITATFQICKNRCDGTEADMVITNDEYRDIARWLNRSGFCKLQVLYDDRNDPYRDPCYFNAGFNLSRIVINDQLYGIELTMETDSPFGYGPMVSKTATIASANGSFTLLDPSDDIGFVYPDVVLTCGDSGAFTISNALTGTTTTITGCTSSEVITMRGDTMTISSSLSAHDIAGSFNFMFLKVGNTFQSRKNLITVSKPCTITISYNPVVKDFV